MLLHNFISLDILVAFSLLRFGSSAKKYYDTYDSFSADCTNVSETKCFTFLRGKVEKEIIFQFCTLFARNIKKGRTVFDKVQLQTIQSVQISRVLTPPLLLWQSKRSPKFKSFSCLCSLNRTAI